MFGSRACSFFPFLLTLISFLLLILVYIGNTSLPTSVPHKFYFLRLNTSEISLDESEYSTTTTKRDSDYSSTNTTDTTTTTTTTTIADWYTIGLWNYCAGDSNSTTPTICGSREIFFYFDPLTVWGLSNDTTITDSTDYSTWESAIDEYEKAARWMTIAYLVAFLATISALSSALPALCCGRVGSLFGAVAASIASVFTITASATATAIFIILKKFVAADLETYGVSASLGSSMLAATWCAAVFAGCSAIAWLVGCCCGGQARSRQEQRKRAREGHGELYERVPSPSKGGMETGTWYGQEGKDVPLEVRGADRRYEDYRVQGQTYY